MVDRFSPFCTFLGFGSFNELFFQNKHKIKQKQKPGALTKSFQDFKGVKFFWIRNSDIDYKRDEEKFRRGGPKDHGVNWNKLVSNSPWQRWLCNFKGSRSQYSDAIWCAVIETPFISSKPLMLAVHICMHTHTVRRSWVFWHRREIKMQSRRKVPGGHSQSMLHILHSVVSSLFCQFCFLCLRSSLTPGLSHSLETNWNLISSVKSFPAYSSSQWTQSSLNN